MEEKTHLAFYTKHGITPVTYDMQDLRAHLERRGSLYRSLGLNTLAIRGADVLEVAAGTGQNSLYVAACAPRSLTLVEPNPSGLKQLRELYAKSPVTGVTPEIVDQRLEHFSPKTLFDVVICENWLGRAAHEIALLRKLATFVRPGGVLVVTALSPIGLVPNIVRRGLAARLAAPYKSFADQTACLTAVFAPHLATMSAMTRSPTDWVQDNMLNPAYFDLAVSIPQQMDALGKEFEILGTNPVFAQDWRWFKALHGGGRAFNEQVLGEYWRHGHNFFDYRERWEPRDLSANRELDQLALALIDDVRALGASATAQPEIEQVIDRLAAIIANVSTFSRDGANALREASHALSNEPQAECPLFRGLFGRETLYASYLRVGD